MQFSDLTVEFPGPTNRLYQHVERLRDTKTDLIDLVSASVHEAGIAFPPDLLDDLLGAASGRARIYRPDSLGQVEARAAIARYMDNAADQILITPGTSVSYWYAFRLLAERGDEILCPTPSYPLFDYIARMSGVELSGYELDEDREWRIDLDQLEHRIGPRTRAIVLISPHNPTGMVADRTAVEGLAAIARKHEVAIISDEVFREFTFGGVSPASPAKTDAPLVFSLNGFSKMFALPGMKVGWMSVSGDQPLVTRAMRTLEMMSDTFLPVNEIAQFVVPGIFEKGRPFLTDYKRRIEAARDDAVAALGSRARVPPAGGFYTVIPIGNERDEDELAITLATEEHVLVHPGYFYDIEGQHIVLSFVGARDRVLEGIRRMRSYLG